MALDAETIIRQICAENGVQLDHMWRTDTLIGLRISCELGWKSAGWAREAMSEHRFHRLQRVKNDWGEHGIVTSVSGEEIWVEHDYGTFRYTKREWAELMPLDRPDADEDDLYINQHYD